VPCPGDLAVHVQRRGGVQYIIHDYDEGRIRSLPSPVFLDLLARLLRSGSFHQVGRRSMQVSNIHHIDVATGLYTVVLLKR
jgi:hypothetical protein